MYILGIESYNETISSLHLTNRKLMENQYFFNQNPTNPTQNM